MQGSFPSALSMAQNLTVLRIDNNNFRHSLNALASAPAQSNMCTNDHALRLL